MVQGEKIIDFQYLLSFLCIPSVINVLSYLKFGDNTKNHSFLKKKCQIEQVHTLVDGNIVTDICFNNKLKSNIQKKSSVSDFKSNIYNDKRCTTKTSDTDVHLVEWGWWVDTMKANTKKKKIRYTMPRISEYS